VLHLERSREPPPREPPADEKYPLPPALESEVPVASPPEMVRNRGSGQGLLAPPRDRARITQGLDTPLPEPPPTAAAAARCCAAGPQGLGASGLHTRSTSGHTTRGMSERVPRIDAVYVTPLTNYGSPELSCSRVPSHFTSRAHSHVATTAEARPYYRECNVAHLLPQDLSD